MTGSPDSDNSAVDMSIVVAVAKVDPTPEGIFEIIFASKCCLAGVEPRSLDFEDDRGGESLSLVVRVEGEDEDEKKRGEGLS